MLLSLGFGVIELVFYMLLISGFCVIGFAGSCYRVWFKWSFKLVVNLKEFVCQMPKVSKSINQISEEQTYL